MIKIAVFFLILSLPTMNYAQNTTLEPVLTGTIASKMIKAAFAEAEKDNLFVTVTYSR